MKIHYIAFLLFLLISSNSTAQETRVEKSLFGIQTGLLGIWAHNESRLADEFTLRTEVGFDAGFWSGMLYEENGFVLVPTITAAPRWYYNLNKRVEKSKKTINNSANFLALEVNYYPDWFLISNSSNINVVNQIGITPKWAMKRTIGKHFVYELGGGVRYGYILDDYYGNNGDFSIALHLRLGYNF